MRVFMGLFWGGGLGFIIGIGDGAANSIDVFIKILDSLFQLKG